MRINDYIIHSFSNLWKRKLRTSLTVCGIVIGIGALVSMISFGKGMQSNVSERFNELELFNYIMVYPGDQIRLPGSDPDRPPLRRGQARRGFTNKLAEEPNNIRPILDDELITELIDLKGVQVVFPEMRFPANIRFNERDYVVFVQVLPASICDSELVQLAAGQPYTTDDANSVVISESILRRFDVYNVQDVIGKYLEIFTLNIDIDNLNPAMLMSFMQNQQLPFSQKAYNLEITGVVKSSNTEFATPLRSTVFVPTNTAENMEKITVLSISDLFLQSEKREGYSSLSVRLEDAKYVNNVREYITKRGYNTFSFLDQIEQMQKVFILMDMFLFAIGMIAITVASLGIVNTMVMSVLERYREIGIMKAVGAGDSDIIKIFLFECATIGLTGGVGGLIFGWFVSQIINIVANLYLARLGETSVDIFLFPIWLCIGAITFSIIISLIAGIYPAFRAARVDPVVALRHD